MTTTTDLLIDSFERVRDEVHAVLDGLSVEDLTYRPDIEANSIAWLVWHLTRIQDDHVADVAGVAQAWTDDQWADRFALPFDRSATGYGQGPTEVAAVRAGADLLGGYFDATHRRTIEFLRTLGPDELTRVVDKRWNPPVTLAVRLVSVLADDLQHTGQAAYVRGLLDPD